MRNIILSILLITWLICLVSCDNIETESSDVQKLKLYNLAVQRVKKVHDYYALISDKEVVFLNGTGEKKFSIKETLFVSDTTSTFRFNFSDAVGLPNGDIYVLATEIRKDYVFRLYLGRYSNTGLSRDHPKMITFKEPFRYYTTNLNRHRSINFTFKENGYALATVLNNEIIVVVNYQTSQNEYWSYRLLTFSEDGDTTGKKDYKSKYLNAYTYMIDVLPDNSIVLVRGVNNIFEIIQYDPVSFEIIRKIFQGEADKVKLENVKLCNMLSWSENEVIFTGHADKRNNLILSENVDVFCVRFNFLTCEIVDSMLSGLVNNNELSFHSFKDQDNIIHCIGTKRGDFLTTPSVESNLLEVKFNLETHSKDSLELIKNKGYEGLFAEPDDDAQNGLKVLGSKMDISGKQNIQGFFMQFKNP